MILLPLIARVDRAAPEDPRRRPGESDLLERVVETAVASLVAAAAWVAMAMLVACAFAEWGVFLGCQATVGVFRRLGGLVRARSTPAGGEARGWGC